MTTEIHNRIVELYGPKVLRKSAMNIRGGAGVFRHFMQGKGYKTALEIGTYRGCSSAEMAQYCEKVVTIDLKHGKLEHYGENFDRYAFWKSLSIDNIELHLVEDDKEKAELVNRLQFDFAFIDGAHDETIRNDFELTRKCGRVLFHDADLSIHHDRNAVYNFIKTLPPEQVEFMDIFAMWTDGHSDRAV